MSVTALPPVGVAERLTPSPEIEGSVGTLTPSSTAAK